MRLLYLQAGFLDTYMGLSFISGIGAHVKETVSRRKGFLPHTSDKAPISGALRNDKIP
jgi:hypothetical protein